MLSGVGRLAGRWWVSQWVLAILTITPLNGDGFHFSGVHWRSANQDRSEACTQSQTKWAYECGMFLSLDFVLLPILFLIAILGNSL